MNTEFKRFIQLSGSRREAAKRLGCSYELVCKIASGEASCTGPRAIQVARLEPEISIVGLIEGGKPNAA